MTNKANLKIGILALQGGFDLHVKRLIEIGVEPVLIKKEEELIGIKGLIIPGLVAFNLLAKSKKSLIGFAPRYSFCS